MTTVLAEEALGGPTALRPTPIQAAAGTVRLAFFFPARWYVEQVNRAVNRVKQRRSQAAKRPARRPVTPTGSAVQRRNR